MKFFCGVCERVSLGGGGGEGKRGGRARGGERNRESKGHLQRSPTMRVFRFWHRGGTRRSRHSGTPSASARVKEAWW